MSPRSAGCGSDPNQQFGDKAWVTDRELSGIPGGTPDTPGEGAKASDQARRPNDIRVSRLAGHAGWDLDREGGSVFEFQRPSVGSDQVVGRSPPRP